MPSVVPTLRLDEKFLGAAMLAINEAQRAFVHAKVFGGMSNTRAAEAAGYSDSSDDVLKSAGHRLAHDPKIQEAILECSKQLLRAEGAASVRELVRLRDHSEDDKVRLRAATELCDRAGLNAISQHNIDVTHTHQLSEAALDARILSLAKEAGLDEASARKLLIDPSKVVDAEFTEVPPEKTPEQAERAERYERTNEAEQQRLRRAMTPEQKAEHKAAMREKRRADEKAKFDEAQARQMDLEEYHHIPEEIRDLM